MELSVGMYVRTEYGISKIINIFPEKRATFIETDNGLGNCSVSGISHPRGLHKGIYLLEEDYEMFIKNNVKKTIIELIQVGDYVNGSKVQEIGEGYVEIEEYSGLNNDMPCVVKAEDIKSVVTKEQFSQREYKVGE